MNTKKEYIKQLANEKGIYHIFAIDHRDVFTDALSKTLGHVASEEEVIQKKQMLIDCVAPFVSGYLVDPIYGVKNHSLCLNTHGIPFMMGIENSNYSLDALNDGYLYEGISVSDIKALKGSMVKLFVYYHPDEKIGKKACLIIEQVATICQEQGIPFLLEPILYSDVTLTQKQRLSLTIQMLEQLKKYPIDIYKLAFPGDFETCREEENIEICKQITNLLQTPWIVLSSGVDRKAFQKQIELAGKGGACGYAVGRSVWGNHLGNQKEDEIAMIQAMKDIVDCANTFCCSVEETLK